MQCCIEAYTVFALMKRASLLCSVDDPVLVVFLHLGRPFYALLTALADSRLRTGCDGLGIKFKQI